MTIFVFICLFIITFCSVLTSLVMFSTMKDINDHLCLIKTKMYEINAIVTDIRYYEKAQIASSAREDS